MSSFQPQYHPSLSLQKLAFSTYSLSERLAVLGTPIEDFNHYTDDIARKRLQTWQKIAAKNDLTKFSYRLSWSGFSQDQVLAALAGSEHKGEYQVKHQVPGSDWLICLQSVLDIANNYSPKSSQKVLQHRCFQPESPIPFESVYLPFLTVAENNLPFTNCFTLEAVNQLLHSLLRNLAAIGAPTLMAEFERFRSKNISLRDYFLIHSDKISTAPRSQQKFQNFLEFLFEDGLWGLFQKYPVLAKLLSIAVVFWCESISEFQFRLEQDWKQIEEYFSPNQSLTQVVECQCNLSDLHHRGRSVILITFDTGLKLVYKPRDLSIDCAFNQMLEWCNHQSNILSMRTTGILNRDTHGWMEFIPNLPCEDELSVTRFYERSGMLLAILYLLEGTDCHQENIIANGEYPVFIDGETLFHHQIEKINNTNYTSLENASKILQRSVLKTFLLPQWGVLPNDTLAVDVSGLGSETQTYETHVWKHVNTDSMRLGIEQTTVLQGNVPTLLRKTSEQTIDMSFYQLEVIRGFEKMYLVLLSQREFLLSADSPLQVFARKRVRFVFRNTKTYYAILQNSYSPQYMKNGIDRSIAFESLSRAFLTSDQCPTHWSMLDAEIQSLEQMDIPFFTSLTNDVHIYLPNQKKADTLTSEQSSFRQSSFNVVQNNLRSLSEEGLQTQLTMIKGAFKARFLQEPSLPNLPLPINIQNSDYFEGEANQALLETAIIFGESVVSKGITGSDSGLAWIGLTYKPTISRFRWNALGGGLWDGNIGIAIFFAALAKITGKAQWHQYTEQTLIPLQATFADLTSSQQCRIGTDIGIAGLGAMIYGLEVIGKLLDNPSPRLISKKILDCITPELIESDIYFTALNGSAGGILGLLAIAESSPIALDLAKKCGNHLVNQRGTDQKTPKPIGFAGGMAGIAYSLLRLYKTTRDEIYLEIAKEAIGYERLSFDPQSKLWADMRTNPSSISLSWATGTAGIGLARLGGLSELDTPNIREEIDYALQAIKRYSLWGKDDLMWGNCGRIETLLVSAHTFKDPALLALTKSWCHIIQKSYRLPIKNTNHFINPAYLHGVSGIGYTFLRLIHPDLLPCILLMNI
ncbi:type 2 lantipeptide synthetase LanM [Pseudanabaena sp. FACHB-1998]|uniref:type 2 lanthipeptide synthetase LanM family protein n=1 Tax=Pseudanabaena sp. FACHB-1998 TaxID=2692858 RepID=UPI001681B69B|nr:type 2 lanthipeptide synthetase LanM family protein [Pseudanabaena sp. FACHB-1998]MBD2179223.1 type 2 lantipeptide synthetase LanM [Pseudanabaena sp. FACHB-1998]